MKLFFTFSLIAFFACASFAQSLFTQPTYYGPMYLHECSSTNVAGHVTTLDDSEIGNTGSDKLIFTHRYATPSFTHNAYLTTATGIYYYGSWAIFDETFNPLSLDLAFNVLNVKQNGTIFTHTVTADNIPWDLPNCSLLDHPSLNNNPNAIILLSKTWDNMVYNTKHVGVYYDPFYNKWCIYNEDNSGTLPINSTYNIFIPNASSSCYTHTSTENSYITVINHTLLNNNINANLFVSHDWGSSGPYFNHELGVWFNGTNWTIYAEDLTPIPAGTKFNIVVASNTPYVDADIPESNKISIFPNPASESIKISNLPQKDIKYTLFNAEGKLVMSGIISNQNNELNVANFEEGLYVIKFPGTNIESQKINIIR